MSSSVCILTDSTVQFIHPGFEGQKLVHILDLKTTTQKLGQRIITIQKTEELPPSARNDLNPVLQIPTSEQFRVKYLELASDFNEIVVMLHSSHLSEATLNAQEAADAVRGRISVQVIDTLTISVGLGYLVEAAASAAIANTPSTEIERTMRGMIPRIYSVFCVPGLTYLYSAGHLGKAQALVGEMLNILPIFSLEEGRLTPVEKMRNPRHLIDFLQEFMDEFSDLDQISIVQGTPPLIHEIKIIKDHIAEYFPDTPLSEHTINLPAATMLGPRTLGFFLVEQANGSS